VEDEIDLRDFFNIFIRRWKWIVSLTIVAALVAAVASFMVTPTYEATATLAVSVPANNSAQTSPTALLAILQSINIGRQTHKRSRI
jgi:uncharacterized protein involved in exopolysaccharide biosynthesis